MGGTSSQETRKINYDYFENKIVEGKIIKDYTM